jgi:hypothetical protein
MTPAKKKEFHRIVIGYYGKENKILSNYFTIVYLKLCFPIIDR